MAKKKPEHPDYVVGNCSRARRNADRHGATLLDFDDDLTVIEGGEWVQLVRNPADLAGWEQVHALHTRFLTEGGPSEWRQSKGRRK